MISCFYIVEVQVDDLQGEIKRLKEHIRSLSRENENLKYKVKAQIFDVPTDNDSTTRKPCNVETCDVLNVHQV